MEHSIKSQLQKAKTMAKRDELETEAAERLPAWLASNTQFQFGGLVDPVKKMLDQLPLLVNASEAVRLRYFQDCVAEITRLLYIVEQTIMENATATEAEQTEQLNQVEVQFAEQIRSIQQILNLS